RSWEIPSGRKLAELEGFEAPAPRLAVSRDGRLLAGAPVFSGQFKLWSLSNSPPTQLSAWESGFSVLTDLAFSPDGLTLLAGGGTAQLVRRYDLSDPGQPRRLPDLEDSDGPMAISPDGQWLATARSYGQPFRVWIMPSLAPVSTNFVRGSRLMSLEFS